ncbi:YbaB/EbfC family nucleoid-associated protein [Candidatus Falkowbacteria bacterium]|jgi:DNA-binding protein YbaB|nr:YbaB/EbfC family nucleoid-associated protein [Candidatus Falkowbacteria bacterium]MBT4433148.1 YbaB/EbfC family nucleoid-associated protein [Candidatus Falkowbacteria bacterium]
MFDKLKQLREMQKQAKEVQKTLADEIITVQKGELEIKINGNMEIQSINIASMESKEDLERDIKEGMNNAIKEAQQVMAKKMMGGGMSLPGM